MEARPSGPYHPVWNHSQVGELVAKEEVWLDQFGGVETSVDGSCSGSFVLDLSFAIFLLGTFASQLSFGEL